MTPLVLGLIFIVAGTWLLNVLGVTVADFLIAGGPFLLVLAVSDIVVGGHLLGRNGLRAASKVVSLLLAVIAINLIREGPMSRGPLI